jgi:hypothetical protein
MDRLKIEHPGGRPMLASTGLALLLSGLAAAEPAPSRKALLIGIDRYDGSPPLRLRQLRGAVQDARAMAALLKEKFRFEVRVLADGDATRAGILSAVQETLVQGTAAGDVRVFFYSGHGSQVQNPASPELDKLDEAIVPFDAPAGAPYIRDKELARDLGTVIDRGGILTVLLDSCHSGSATRGSKEQDRYPGEAKIAPIDPRTVADPSRPIPPESRGALVLSAAQDLESALEVDIPNAGRRGAFTWALVEALSDRDAATEPAHRIFYRAKQKMDALTAQRPVIAGTLQRQRASIFDAGPAVVTARVEVPVTRKGDRLEVGAGSALGLGVGSILEGKAKGKRVRLEVASVEGPSAALARVLDGSPAAVGDGGLFAVVRWAAAPGSNLLVGLDGAVEDGELKRLVKVLQELRKKKGVEWIEHPDDPKRTHWLELDGDRRELWCLFGPDGKADKPLTDSELAGWTPPPGVQVRLFAALPPSKELAEGLKSAWSRPGGLVQVALPRPAPDSSDERRCLRADGQAAYRLLGRLAKADPEYAWRLTASIASANRGAAPPVSDFASPAASEGGTPSAIANLRGTAERLARVLGWLNLRSSATSDAKFPYRLVLRRSDGKDRGDGDRVVAGETYGLALRARAEALKGAVQRRWIYVFGMDSFGSRQLLYPIGELGDVENLLPPEGTPPAEVSLVKELFRVSPPFGTDTYFLLASDQKLPDPLVLSEEGVRTRGLKGGGENEALPIDLLAPVMTRGMQVGAKPADWTLRRLTVTSAEVGP